MAKQLPGVFAGLNNDGIAVAKSVFRYMTVRSELRFRNGEAKASPRAQAALDDLVQRGAIAFTEDDGHHVYKPALDVDFGIFDRVAMPRDATFPMTVAIDKGK